MSDSADLSRLGLTQAHCELAIAELARGIFLAGGTILYGGRLVPAGFTDILLDELRRYREDRDALILCLPESEHRRFNNDELSRREQELHSSAELVCLNADGEPVNVADRTESRTPIDVSAALTGMRQHITNRCHARVLVGGSLRVFQGAMPGVIEEAILSVQARQPLYVAGGFGGAAAAIASALGYEEQSWYPPDFPEGAEEQAEALARLSASIDATPLVSDGLSLTERHQLAATHRPGDISSLVVTGLGRLAGQP